MGRRSSEYVRGAKCGEDTRDNHLITNLRLSLLQVRYVKYRILLSHHKQDAHSLIV